MNSPMSKASGRRVQLPSAQISSSDDIGHEGLTTSHDESVASRSIHKEVSSRRTSFHGLSSSSIPTLWSGGAGGGSSSDEEEDGGISIVREQKASELTFLNQPTITMPTTVATATTDSHIDTATTMTGRQRQRRRRSSLGSFYMSSSSLSMEFTTTPKNTHTYARRRSSLGSIVSTTRSGHFQPSSSISYETSRFMEFERKKDLLTKKKLRFDDLDDLFGRDDEIIQLEELFNQACAQSTSKSCVLNVDETEIDRAAAGAGIAEDHDSGAGAVDHATSGSDNDDDARIATDGAAGISRRATSRAQHAGTAGMEADGGATSMADELVGPGADAIDSAGTGEVATAGGVSTSSHVKAEGVSTSPATVDRDRVDGTTGCRNLIIIKGQSGSGKTALAMKTLQKKVLQRQRSKSSRTIPILVSGKFNVEDQIGNTYKPIVDAFTQVCAYISANWKTTTSATSTRLFEELQKDLQSQLGTTELELFQEMIPELMDILPITEEEDRIIQRASSAISDTSTGSSNKPALDKNNSFVGETAEISHIGNEQHRARFLYAFQTFYKILCQYLSPLVMILDDVQWIDSSSIDILRTLFNDVNNKNLFVVCIYRAEEVDEAHLFSKLLFNIRGRKERLGPLIITQLETGPLTVQDVNAYLMRLLDYDVDDTTKNESTTSMTTSNNAITTTLPLAELCHRRTLGNIFFTITFLKKLCGMKLLTFDIAKHQWTWDIQQIVEGTVAMTNVVELMKSELQLLPKPIQIRLSVAACLGNTFQPRIVNGIMQNIASDSSSTLSVGGVDSGRRGQGQNHRPQDGQEPNWLAVVEDRGLIELQSGDTYTATVGGFADSVEPDDPSLSYQWIHDKVREGALAIVTPERLRKLKGTIGRQLLETLTAEDVDAMIFIIANLLHDGPSIDEENRMECLKLARINLQAAQKAVGVSAFSTALIYANRGLDLLPLRYRWEPEHREISLELCTLSAETAEFNGLADLVQERYEDVVSREDIPIEDKLDIYSTQIKNLGATARIEHAVDLVVYVLGLLKIKFPKTSAGRTISMIIKLLRVKRKYKALTKEQLLNLPDMDSTEIMKMSLLKQLAEYGYSSDKNKPMMPLAILTAALRTLKCGVSMFAPANIAQLGVVFTGVMQDYELGGRLGVLAMNLMEQRNYTSIAPATTFQVHQFLRCWLDPLTSCQPQYTQAYKGGLLVGDTEFSMWSMWAYIVSGFQTGRPLQQLEHDCRIYASQMMVYHRNLVLRHLIPYWLCFVKLIGNKGYLDVEPLLGKTDPSLSLAEFHQQEAPENDQLKAAVGALQNRLDAIFRHNVKDGADHAIETGDHFTKNNPALHPIMPETFARGISLYAMAIETRQSRYIRHARKIHKVVKKWKKAGNPNVIHYVTYFDAEEAVLKRKYQTAESLYLSAKTVAARSGLIQDSALATERYGEMLLRQNNTLEASAVFEESILLYQEWGAYGKAEQLQKKLSLL